MPLLVRPPRPGDDPAWIALARAARAAADDPLDEGELRDALRGDPRAVLVAWEGRVPLGALVGTATPGGFRIEGHSAPHDRQGEVEAALLAGLHERSPGQLLEAYLPATEDVGWLRREGYEPRGRELRVACDLVRLPAESRSDPFSYASLREVGLPRLREALARCWPAQLDLEAELDDLLDLIEGEPDPLWAVVALDGVEVGVVLARLFARGAARAGTILFMGVFPEARGRGLAKALHAATLHRLRAAGAQRYVDATREENAPMQRVFAANGCTPRGTWQLLQRHPRPAVTSPGASPVEALVRWLEREGARVRGLTIDEAPDRHRGARATADLPRGATVLELPRRAILTRELASTSRVGRALARARARLESEDSSFAAFLLDERARPDSVWRALIDALPASFPEHPFFFDAATLRELEGTGLARVLEERRASLARDHEALRAALPDWQHTLDAFTWARLVIVSRVFGLTLDGVPTRCLVPLADMLNHRRPAQADVSWGYSEELQRFTMHAARDIARGEPVCDTYGEKSNVRYLLGYGFVLEDNLEQETVTLELALPHDRWELRRREVLGLPAGGTRSCTLPYRCELDDALTEALIFLRVALANAPELSALLDGTRTPASPLSPVNERRTRRALHDVCRRALADYPTTIEEDERLLAAGGLDPRVRSCVVVRLAEKRVLERVAAFLQETAPQDEGRRAGPTPHRLDRLPTS